MHPSTPIKARLTNQLLGQYAIYFLCFVTAIRLIRDMIVKWIPTIEPGTDMSFYIDAAQALTRGANPFDSAELLLGRSVAPIIFPTQALLISPFYAMGPVIGTVAFFFLNVVLSLLMFKLIFKQIDLWHPPTSLTLSTKNQLFLFSFCLFLNSPELKHCLYIGQLSLIAFSCLFFAMFAKGVFFRSLLLALALAAKYSVVPFIGLAFLIIRDFRTCILAAILFLAFAAVPVLLGHNLFTLYTEYFTKLSTTMVGLCGHDTYCGGRGVDTFLHFELFKNDVINLVVKTILFIPFIIAFFLEYQRKNVGLNFLLFASAIMLVVAYHRFYDLLVLQIFMIAFLNICFYRKLWLQGSIFAIFILFSLVPIAWVNDFEYVLGTLVGDNAWIYTRLVERYPITFPLFAVYTLVVTCFSIYLYFHRNLNIIFLRKDAHI